MLADLTEEERFLYALLMDESGVDVSEFLWVDPTSKDDLFRAYDYQFSLYRSPARLQVDLLGRSLGKALSQDTPIPTLGGWSEMGCLQVGDLVFDEEGSPTEITGVSAIQYERPCYRVAFDDGNSIVADGEHLWPVDEFVGGSEWIRRTITTSELHAGMVSGSGVSRWRTLPTPILYEGTNPLSRGFTITTVDPVESVPVRCIQVAASSRLYLAGKGMVPTHNSLGIQMRAFAFPFSNPGEEMLITAPEMIHLDPVTKAVERRLEGVRIGREMLKTSATSRGLTHRPFEATFKNGARIIGRIPQADGKGVKGSCGGNTLVLTIDGHVPADKVKVGDRVLTAEGRFMPVLHVYSSDAECVEVAGAGHRGLVVSSNHRFWARRNVNPQRARNLTPATWLIVSDDEAAERWYWASPTQFPSMPIPQFPPDVKDDSAFLWMCGRYVADGCLVVSGGSHLNAIAISDSLDGIQQFDAVARLAGYEPHRRFNSGAHEAWVHRATLARWLYEHFGRYSEGKRVPTWLLGAPGFLRNPFLDGYLSGDGYYNQGNRRWEASSASRDLALGIKFLGQVHGYSTGFTWVDPKVTHIMGRELPKKPRRSFRVNLSEHSRGIIEPGVAGGPRYQWGRIRSVKPVGVQTVYDLVVAEDYSYVADGIVHKGSRFLPGEGDD